MQAVQIATVLCVGTSTLCSGGPGLSDKWKKDFGELIQSIPRQTVIDRYRSLIVEDAVPWYKGELESAKKEIEKLKESLPKLKSMIRVGKSIFDHPGLLSKGTIHFDEFSNNYEMYIGIYLRSHEGQGPFDFYIDFDGRGKITGTREVNWKH